MKAVRPLMLFVAMCALIVIAGRVTAAQTVSSDTVNIGLEVSQGQATTEPTSTPSPTPSEAVTTTVPPVPTETATDPPTSTETSTTIVPTSSSNVGTAPAISSLPAAGTSSISGTPYVLLICMILAGGLIAAGAFASMRRVHK